MASESERKPHRWRFFRSGGFDQVRISTGADIAALGELDPKLWAALACPTTGLVMDPRTLQVLDVDGDGRIRVPEVIEAASWAARLFKNPDELLAAQDSLPLTSIDDSTPEGAEVLASAKQILGGLGKSDATTVSIEDTVDTNRIFAQTHFNGDGIVPMDAAEDEATRKVIEEIMACVGSEMDRSGKPGISQDKADQFFAEAKAYSDWWATAQADADNLLPFGDDTEITDALYDALKPKIDDFFTRQRLTEFDPLAAASLNPAAEDYQALATRSLSPEVEAVAALPIAAVSAGGSLPLAQGVNPAWADPLARFRKEVVTPLLGDRATLTAADWTQIKARFAAHAEWIAAKQGEPVASLGLARVREVLGTGVQAAVDDLIARDKALEGAANAIGKVERLVRFRRDLATFLNNFVSFRDFYTGEAKAIFQAGTLYLDGRSCDLCVRVEDIDKHAALANRSRTYLAYCECQRRGADEKMNIAAAFTDGTPDNLMVGRNGVFYDRQGRDWDATIVKILEHPMSMRQAFWEPYKRIGRMISDQVEKLVSKKGEEAEKAAAAAMSEKAEAAAAGAPPAHAEPFDIGKFAGIFAAIGLAIGAIGTAIASVVTGFLGLVWWEMPLAILGLMLLVSGPSMIISYLKLRSRTLAPILDANGWAVNTQATINVPFGESLTSLATLPPDAERSLLDPFAQRRTPWRSYLFGLALVVLLGSLWHNGVIQKAWEQLRAKAPPPATQPAPAPAAPAEPAKAEAPPATK